MDILSVEYNGENHDVPDHIAMRIDGTNYTQDQAKADTLAGLEKFYNNGGTPPAATPAAAATATEETPDEDEDEGKEGGDAKPAGTGAAAAQEDGKGAAGETPATPNMIAYAKEKFGAEIETEEDLAEIFAKHKTLTEREAAIAAKEVFWQDIENPHANDELAAINKFVKTAGLNDLVLAKQILFTPREALLQDPILAMAIAKVIENPDHAKTFDFEAIKGRIQRQAERTGVDLRDKESDAYKDFQMEALENIQKIEKYREGFGKSTDSIAVLQQNKQQQEQLLGERLTSLKAEISKLGLKQVTHKFGDKEVSLEAPKDILSLIPDSVQRHLARTIDTSTKDGKAELKQALNDYIVISQHRSGELGAAIWKQAEQHFEANKAEKVVAEKMNGGQKTHAKGGKQGGVTVVTEVQKEIDQAWKQS